MDSKKLTAILWITGLAVLCFFGGFFWVIFYIANIRPQPHPIVQTPPQSYQVKHEVKTEVATSTLLDAASGLTSYPKEVPSFLPPKPPQFVLLSFDGSYSLDQWRQTRQFTKDMAAKGINLKFTYFISGVYLLAPKDRNVYQPPVFPAGHSAIGFAASEKDVANRIEQINSAIQEGHEIASHANGHFDGSKWSYANWKQELSQFNHLVFDAGFNNHLTQEPPLRQIINLPPLGIVGFRAPVLGRNDSLFKSLADAGYRYDASSVAKAGSWPVKNKYGLWSFPLSIIKFATTSQNILSMDYNFYFKQSGAKDVAVKGSPEWNLFYNQMIVSYEKYFNDNYHGSRAPVIIGHHFSEWNDGVYWEVMKKFASEVCSQPDVRCVTFSTLADYLDTQAKSTSTKP